MITHVNVHFANKCLKDQSCVIVFKPLSLHVVLSKVQMGSNNLSFVLQSRVLVGHDFARVPAIPTLYLG